MVCYSPSDKVGKISRFQTRKCPHIPDPIFYAVAMIARRNQPISSFRLLANMGKLLHELSVFSDCWPLLGWSNKSFHEYSTGPAKNDVYGKLNHYLRDIFTQFHQRIRAVPVNITVTNITCRLALSSSFEKGRFHRISVIQELLLNIT